MPVYRIEELVPVVDPSAYVHPAAVIIGDVIIGPGCYVAPCAVLRGDFGRLILSEGVNVQDTCVMHGYPDGDTVIEPDGHIGHGAVIHGAHIGRNVLVGMNAVVMDGAEIGDESIIGACAFVRAGFTCPPRSLVLGAPATVKREVTDQEFAWKTEGTAQYHELNRRARASLVPTAPLTEVQPDRPRYSSDIKPLHERR